MFTKSFGKREARCVVCVRTTEIPFCSVAEVSHHQQREREGKEACTYVPRT